MDQLHTTLRFVFLLVIFVLNLPCTYTQQLPIFTQYREYQGYINPASVTSEYLLYEQRASVGLSYRKQWVSRRESPHTQLLHASYLITPNQKYVSLYGGGYLINDQAGILGQTGAYMRLAGIVSNDPYMGGFALGLSFGLSQFGLDVEGLNTLEDEQLPLPSDFQRNLKLDIGIGLFAWRHMNNGNTVYGGLSVPQLTQPEVNLTEDVGFRWEQHYFALAGCYFFLDRFSFIEPSVWVKYVPFAPIHADFNVRWQRKRLLWVGGGYGTDGTMHFETGFLYPPETANGKNKTLKIGYGFDYPFNVVGSYYGSSHELNLTYSFGK